MSKNYNNLYCIGELKKSAIKKCTARIWTHEAKWYIFNNKRNTISEDIAIVLGHYVRSFSNDVDDIVSDNRIINNKIIGFTDLLKSFQY